MTIGLIATIKVQSGKGAEFEAAFGKLQAAVRAGEPGNLQYDLFRSKDEADTYVVYEQYADEAALEAHRSAPHARTLGAAVGATLAGRPQVLAYEKVS